MESEFPPDWQDWDRREQERADHFGDGEPADRLLSLFDLSKIDGPPPPARAWIVPDYVPANEVTLFTGPGGAGKSLLSQQLATALSTGGRCLGMDLAQAGVLFVTAEDGEDELHRRQCAIGAPDPAKLFLASLRGVLATELATFDREGQITLTPLFEMIRATLEHTGASVLILDNLAHLFGGNENDRGQVTRFVNCLYSLRRELARDLTILLVGHPNKSGDTYSGSTAWLNAVRSQVEIARTDTDGDLDGRVMRVGKANYARLGTETRFRWHDGAFVLDSDLSDETRHQLDEAIRTSGENEAFMRCLRVRSEQGRDDVGPNPGPNYAPARFAEMPQAKGHSKTALGKAMERLFELGRIEARQVKREGKGTTKTIIVEAPNPTPEPIPNTSPEPSRTPPEHTPRTHSPLTGGNGRALGGDAPAPERSAQ